MTGNPEPERSLNLALIGAGQFGKHYLRLIPQLPGVLLRAVVTATDNGLTRRGLQLPAGAAHRTDAVAVLRDPAIDAVVIATPSAFHAELSQAALAAGKHVLVEKPMALTAAEAETVRRAQENAGTVFMVGHQYLYNPYVHHLKTLLADKAFGDVAVVVSEHLVSPVRTDVDVLTDAAPHPLAIMHYLFNPGAIVEVCGRALRTCGGTQTDFVHAAVRFERGPLLALTESWFGPEKTRRLILLGPQTRAVLDETKPEKKLAMHRPNQPEEQPAVDGGEPLKNELGDFIACIRTGKAPVSGIEVGMAVAEWLETISKKLR